MSEKWGTSRSVLALFKDESTITGLILMLKLTIYQVPLDLHQNVTLLMKTRPVDPAVTVARSDTLHRTSHRSLMCSWSGENIWILYFMWARMTFGHWKAFNLSTELRKRWRQMVLIQGYWMITAFMYHDIYLFLQGTMVHVQKTFSNNNCESFSLINSLYQPAQMISRCGLHVCARRAQPDLNSKKPAHWSTTTFDEPKCSYGTFSRK